MLQFKCPKGHRYGIAGYGEDLSWNIWRKGNTEKCPQCVYERLQLILLKVIIKGEWT